MAEDYVSACQDLPQVADNVNATLWLFRTSQVEGKQYYSLLVNGKVCKVEATAITVLFFRRLKDGNCEKSHHDSAAAASDAAAICYGQRWFVG